MSAEEKRAVILKIYHERKEAFNLKEIEALASKAGVVAQTVKDMNQSLVDDSLVQMDKIGAANFFWSFPSKVYQDQLVLKDKLQQQRSNIEANIGHTEQQIEEAQKARVSEDRNVNLIALEKLREEDSALNSRISDLERNDPKQIIVIEKACKVNKESADRWTDNVWLVKAYLTKKRGLQGQDVNKMLGITGDFDYPEYTNQPAAKKKR